MRIKAFYRHPQKEFSTGRLSSIAWWFFLFLLFMVLPLIAGVQPYFSGYVVNLPIYQKNPRLLTQFFGGDPEQILDLTRLRLRPGFYLWKGARIQVEYEWDFLYTSGAFFFFPSAKARPRQTVDFFWFPINKKHFKGQHYIDRLYFRQNWDWGTLVIGRQRISWGSGRIWNPTDLFNPINPASFDKIEKDGADAISLKYFLGAFSDIQLVYNVENNWRKHNLAGRFRTNWKTYDFSLVGGYVDDRIITGGDIAGNLLEAGIRGEILFSINPHRFSSNRVSYILGADYQFTAKLYGLVEFHYNGAGTRNKQNYNLFSVLNGKILNLAKDYIFFQSSYQVHPLATLGIFNNRNLDDGSGFWGATLSISTGDNSSLTIGSQIFYGREFSEYWYYPTAIYLRGDFYF